MSNISKNSTFESKAAVDVAADSPTSKTETLEPQDIKTPTAKNTDHLTRRQLYLRRFLRNKPAVGGIVVLLFLIISATLGPLIIPHTYTDLDFAAISDPPSADHWFGTTDSGADLLAQSLHGLGRSLLIAFGTSFATVLIAAFVGSWAAFMGGKPEKVILAIIHFLLVVPSFLLIALLVGSSGGDWKMLVVVLVLFGWMYQARVIWSLALSVREREYIYAARYMGIPGWKIVFRHIIPNIGSLLVVNATLGVISVVMTETSLSFLGLGIQPPDVSLGNLLGSGAATVYSSWWLFVFPAAILTMLTVSMALISDGLRDALDPNSASGGKA